MIEIKIPKSIEKKIRTGHLRRKFGLETDSGSFYFALRQKGYSDSEAQYMDYKSRGLLKKVV